MARGGLFSPPVTPTPPPKLDATDPLYDKVLDAISDFNPDMLALLKTREQSTTTHANKSLGEDDHGLDMVISAPPSPHARPVLSTSTSAAQGGALIGNAAPRPLPAVTIIVSDTMTSQHDDEHTLTDILGHDTASDMASISAPSSPRARPGLSTSPSAAQIDASIGTAAARPLSADTTGVNGATTLLSRVQAMCEVHCEQRKPKDKLGHSNSHATVTSAPSSPLARPVPAVSSPVNTSAAKRRRKGDPEDPRTPRAASVQEPTSPSYSPSYQNPGQPREGRQVQVRPLSPNEQTFADRFEFLFQFLIPGDDLRTLFTNADFAASQLHGLSMPFEEYLATLCLMQKVMDRNEIDFKVHTAAGIFAYVFGANGSARKPSRQAHVQLAQLLFLGHALCHSWHREKFAEALADMPDVLSFFVSNTVFRNNLNPSDQDIADMVWTDAAIKGDFAEATAFDRRAALAQASSPDGAASLLKSCTVLATLGALRQAFINAAHGFEPLDAQFSSVSLETTHFGAERGDLLTLSGMLLPRLLHGAEMRLTEFDDRQPLIDARVKEFNLSASVSPSWINAVCQAALTKQLITSTTSAGTNTFHTSSLQEDALELMQLRMHDGSGVRFSIPADHFDGTKEPYWSTVRFGDEANNIRLVGLVLQFPSHAAPGLAWFMYDGKYALFHNDWARQVVHAPVTATLTAQDHTVGFRDFTTGNMVTHSAHMEAREVIDLTTPAPAQDITFGTMSLSNDVDGYSTDTSEDYDEDVSVFTSKAPRIDGDDSPYQDTASQESASGTSSSSPPPPPSPRPDAVSGHINDEAAVNTSHDKIQLELIVSRSDDAQVSRFVCRDMRELVTLKFIYNKLTEANGIPKAVTLSARDRWTVLFKPNYMDPDRHSDWMEFEGPCNLELNFCSFKFNIKWCRDAYTGSPSIDWQEGKCVPSANMVDGVDMISQPAVEQHVLSMRHAVLFKVNNTERMNSVLATARETLGTMCRNREPGTLAIMGDPEAVEAVGSALTALQSDSEAEWHQHLPSLTKYGLKLDVDSFADSFGSASLSVASILGQLGAEDDSELITIATTFDATQQFCKGGAGNTVTILTDHPGRILMWAALRCCAGMMSRADFSDLCSVAKDWTWPAATFSIKRNVFTDLMPDDESMFELACLAVNERMPVNSKVNKVVVVGDLTIANTREVALQVLTVLNLTADTIMSGIGPPRPLQDHPWLDESAAQALVSWTRASSFGHTLTGFELVVNDVLDRYYTRMRTTRAPPDSKRARTSQSARKTSGVAPARKKQEPKAKQDKLTTFMCQLATNVNRSPNTGFIKRVGLQGTEGASSRTLFSTLLDAMESAAHMKFIATVTPKDFVFKSAAGDTIDFEAGNFIAGGTYMVTDAADTPIAEKAGAAGEAHEDTQPASADTKAAFAASADLEPPPVTQTDSDLVNDILGTETTNRKSIDPSIPQPFKDIGVDEVLLVEYFANDDCAYTAAARIACKVFQTNEASAPAPVTMPKIHTLHHYIAANERMEAFCMATSRWDHDMLMQNKAFVRRLRQWAKNYTWPAVLEFDHAVRLEHHFDTAKSLDNDHTTLVINILLHNKIAAARPKTGAPHGSGPKGPINKFAGSKQGKSSEICRLFNQGKCRDVTCPRGYKHACSKCGGKHSQQFCKAPAPK